MRKTLILVICAAAGIVSCSKFEGITPGGSGSGTTDPINNSGISYDGKTAENKLDVTIQDYAGQKASDYSDEVGTDEDLYWQLAEVKDKNTISITFNGSEVVVDNPNTKDNEVTADGAHVKITLGKKSRINLSGSSSDGSVRIYPKDSDDASKFVLALSDLTLTSSRGPAINSQIKKRVYVILSGSNTLKDAATYSDDVEGEDSKGCFFSEGNQIWSGDGVLTVTGSHKHAIATDGYFYMHPGPTIVVTDAASNGIKVKGDTDTDCFGGEYGFFMAGGLIWGKVSSTAGKAISCDRNFVVTGGSLILNTTGDAEWDSSENDTSAPSCIKADGNMTVRGGVLDLRSNGKGGKCINVDSLLTVKAGTISAASSGGQFVYGREDSDPKAIKADGDIIIEGGSVSACSTGKTDGSEGIESKSAITISGGEVYVYAYDDAINAATCVTISGGDIYALSLNNDGIDSNGDIYISGGNTYCMGSSREAALDNDNPDAQSTLKISGGTVVGIGGTVYTPSSSTTQCCVVAGGVCANAGNKISILTSGGSSVLSFEMASSWSSAGLLLSSPSITKGSSYTLDRDGTTLCSFTTNSTTTTIGSSMSGGGGGFGPGGPGH